MKTKRQKIILKLIEEKAITTQEMLQNELKAFGFDVTQATVSRDIKSLDLIKVLSPDGGYRYAERAAAATGYRSAQFRSVFIGAVVKVDCAQNIVVLKCHTGMGSAVGAAVDTMDWMGIVGSLAGDDTVFILMRDADSAVKLVLKINEMLGR